MRPARPVSAAHRPAIPLGESRLCELRRIPGELSSSKRKNLRKERAIGARCRGRIRLADRVDITEAHWDKFFEFYMDTGGRKWGHPYLTRDFFSRVGASMAEQILLIIARLNGRAIAGALNFSGDGVLYGRNWGCTNSCRSCISRPAIIRPSNSPSRKPQGRSRRAGRAQAAARLHADADLQRALHRPFGIAPRRGRLSRTREREALQVAEHIEVKPGAKEV
jgi:hypothetical protein